MMKKFNWQEIMTFALAVLPFIGIALVYNTLPAEIPTHWGVNGEIDGYGPKWMQFVLAGIGCFLYGLLYVVPLIDPKRANIEKFGKNYQWLRLGFQFFFTAIIVMTTAVALGYAVDVDAIIRIGISLLFIFIGNSFGKMKQNYMIGIKTPWTLADGEVWNRTHRLAGYVWVGLGLVMLATTLLPSVVGSLIFFICLIVMVIVPFVYSYIIYRQKNKL
ncbi:MAG: SdpI family protein [Culicoidibacterales bacterium]